MLHHRISAIVILSTVLVSIFAPSNAQDLPRLMQGKPYNVERKKLLASGWQKVININKSCNIAANGEVRNGFSRETCFRYQEHEDCSGTGFCAFLWRNAIGKNLRVITYGNYYEVQNWEVK